MSEHARSAPRTTPTPGQDPALEELAIVTDEGSPSTASHVATTARQGATEVARETHRQGRHLLEEARQQLRQQADEQTRHVGEALHELGRRLDALAEGRPEAAGPLDTYAEELAWRIQDVADRIDDLGLEGILADVQRFARRRPSPWSHPRRPPRPPARRSPRFPSRARCPAWSPEGRCDERRERAIGRRRTVGPVPG